MDDPRFDAFTKAFTTTRSRRSLSRLLGGISVGGVLSTLGGTAALARCRPRCGPCKRCRNGRCRRKPDGTACGDGLTCSGGVCAKEPDCLGSSSLDPCGFDLPPCCSDDCSFLAQHCECSGVGQPCHQTTDCCFAACIGFYCDGCRGEGQPCAEDGGGCCFGLSCRGGLCQELIIGG